MKTITTKIIAIAIVILMAGTVNPVKTSAQQSLQNNQQVNNEEADEQENGVDGYDPPPPPDEEDPDAPLDGGVSLLIASTVGYGIKKIRDARKKKDTTII